MSGFNLRDQGTFRDLSDSASVKEVAIEVAFVIARSTVGLSGCFSFSASFSASASLDRDSVEGEFRSFSVPTLSNGAGATGSSSAVVFAPTAGSFASHVFFSGSAIARAGPRGDQVNGKRAEGHDEVKEQAATRTVRQRTDPGLIAKS